MLDDEVFAVEPPNLDNTQCRVNRWPVDLRPREVDLDGKVRIGIVGDVLRLAGAGLPLGPQLFGIEIVG
jgi:hypothetical protein